MDFSLLAIHSMNREEITSQYRSGIDAGRDGKQAPSLFPGTSGNAVKIRNLRGILMSKCSMIPLLGSNRDAPSIHFFLFIELLSFVFLALILTTMKNGAQ
jgi:hypothetical protein